MAHECLFIIQIYFDVKRQGGARSEILDCRRRFSRVPALYFGKNLAVDQCALLSLVKARTTGFGPALLSMGQTCPDGLKVESQLISGAPKESSRVYDVSLPHFLLPVHSRVGHQSAVTLT